MRNFSRVPVKALLALLALFIASTASEAQQEDSHRAPEKLGRVSFAISCRPEVQQPFERAVALLHSFAYAEAEKAFRGVAERDSKCAMAHWGMAMTYFHQLWEPPFSAGAISSGQREIQRAQQLGAGTERERKFIGARASNYERAMKVLASENRKDTETQVFYALALLANSSPADKTHAKQKKAADLLEPLFRAYPQHPGIPHYLIHAYDNAELAPRGRPAAEAYAQIAASTPHALHMPSHIFTRLGLWNESIASNEAARKAARQHGDTGEELHAMDYLVYAYLQNGRDAEAVRVIQEMQGMSKLDTGDFKVEYASTAMPIRYAIERGRWSDAAAIAAPEGVPPYVAAIAVWARGLGMARSGHAAEARAEAARSRELEKKLRASGSEYWAGQVDILTREILAWVTQADGKSQEATAMLREAADLEDATEKLPVTPGPILPAREQLGYLLLEQHQADAALKEFKIVLTNSPGRRGALQGAARAAELSVRK